MTLQLTEYASIMTVSQGESPQAAQRTPQAEMIKVMPTDLGRDAASQVCGGQSRHSTEVI